MIKSEKVVSWLVPFLLTANLGVLVRMSQTIADIAKDLAVVVVRNNLLEVRVDRLDSLTATHESRITILEQKQHQHKGRN